MASQAQLRAAQEAIRQGRRREAHARLIRLAKEDPHDFRVWLLLAGVAGSPRASLEYLERAERLEPGHPTIARAREWAAGKEAAARDGAPAQRAPVTEPTQATGRPRLERPAPPAAEQAARPQTETVDERIARARAARAAKRRAQRRRTAVRAAALALLLLLLAAGGSWAWSQWAPGDGEELAGTPSDAPAVAETAPDTVAETQAEQATGDEDEVVRLQFAPRMEAAATEVPAATPTPLAREVHSKVVSPSGGTPRPTWTVTPSPTPTATPTPTMAPTFISESAVAQPVLRPAGVGPGEKWIDVNLTQQRLVAYEGDAPVFDSLVSSGTWNYPTVTGEFRVYLRFTSQTMDGRRLGYDYYLENVPYVMYFFEDYALHGTYWHNNFGTPMSHGCVNLPTPAAEWIFNWSSMGTLVRVHY